MYAASSISAPLTSRMHRSRLGFDASATTLLGVEQQLRSQLQGACLGAYVIEGDEVRAFDLNLRRIDEAD